MKRDTALILACLADLPASARAQSPPKGDTLRVLLTYGGHAFQEKEFFALWDAMPGVTDTKAPQPQSADLLKPGLEKEYDAIVMYDMDGPLTPEQRRAFVALLDRGIGVVALHHNPAAHNDWDEYRAIIGGKWLNRPETIDGKRYRPRFMSTARMCRSQSPTRSTRSRRG